MADRRPTCRVVDVDGRPVRVRGRHPMTEAESAALTEVIRAARAYLAALPLCTCGHAEQFHGTDAPRPCRVHVRTGGTAGPCACTAMDPREDGEPR